MTRTVSPVDRWYPERRFGGFTHADDTVAFFSRIDSVLEPSMVALDLGCGRGAASEDALPWRRDLRILKGRCARVVGVDPDPAAATNPTIDEFHLMEGHVIPLSDESVDLAFSDFVLEHVEDVPAFLGEAARVLKPGGYLFIRTPNVWSYPVLASRMVPNHLHARILHRLQPDRKEEDVFPTLYRCNSRGKLRQALERVGFACVVHAHESEPSYLGVSRPLYAMGVLYQRYAPQAVRSVLMAFAVKKESPN